MWRSVLWTILWDASSSWRIPYKLVSHAVDQAEFKCWKVWAVVKSLALCDCQKTQCGTLGSILTSSFCLLWLHDAVSWQFWGYLKDSGEGSWMAYGIGMDPATAGRCKRIHGGEVQRAVERSQKWTRMECKEGTEEYHHEPLWYSLRCYLACLDLKSGLCLAWQTCLSNYFICGISRI